MAFLSWFPFSLVATILLGASVAMYKLPGIKGYSKAATTFWFLATSGILSVFFFHEYFSVSTSETILFGALWGVGFAILTILQMSALSHVDTNTLFPVTTTLSLIVSIAAGLTFFSESLSLFQTIGIILAVASIYTFLYKGGKFQFSWLVVSFLISITFFSAFNKIIQKVAADGVDIHMFQVYQYVFGALAALLIWIFTKKDGPGEKLFSGAVMWGAINGVLGFFGGWALLVALTKGPFVLITSIHSMYVFVTALLGFLIFHEKLDKKKIVLIALSIVAIILMRLH